MDEVLELAAKLSKALARSKRFTDLRSAESEVMADTDAVGLIKKRDELMAALRKESDGSPIEPEEKRAVAAADEAVKTNTRLANLNRAQADFQEMLYLVNHEITSALEPAEEEPAADSGAADSSAD